VFLGRVWSGMLEEKLASVVYRIPADQALLPPMPDRIYRDPAGLRNLGDGQQAAFAEPVESALQSISLSNIADRDWCQRQPVACLESFVIQDSGRIGVIVVFQEAVHFGYHGGILSVALAKA
jgi:hypothetical protein